MLRISVCPVLALLNPEIDALVEYFEGTHELTAAGWRRSSLPREGGYGQQDNLLMLQLDHLQRVKQGIWQGRGKTVTDAATDQTT